jgi:hypothetical protein
VLLGGQAWLVLAAASCAVACLPSEDLSSYSSSVRPAATTEPGPGENESETQDPGESQDSPAGGDQTPPEQLAPMDSSSDESDAGSLVSGGVSSADAAVAVPAPDAAELDAGVAPCAAGELFGPDGHCHFIEAVALSWDDARARCRLRGPGWDLTVIQSAAESEFLASRLTLEVWIGASDTASESSWTWVTDTTPFWVGTSTGAAVGGAYSNWNATEPNGSVTTNCARALPNSFGSATPSAPWADLPCAQPLGSVCEDHS